MPLVRLPNGDLRDEIRQTLYDTADYGNAVSPKGTYRYFGNVQGKSAEKTNLRLNQLLETTVSYRVQGLALDAMNTLAANVTVLPLIIERSALIFRVAEKEYWKGPARFAAGRMWQHANNMAAPTLLQQCGQAAIQPVMFSGKHVIDLTPIQSFWCDFEVGQSWTPAEEALATPAALSLLPIVFSLKGLMRRPVQ